MPKKSNATASGTVTKRGYKSKYTEVTLLQAIQDVKAGKSINEAHRETGIPRGTLHNKVHGKHALTVGRPCVLTAEEEEMIIARVLVVGDWGFPFDSDDVRFLVKSYLDRLGVSNTRFVNNYPGREWVICFLKRHRETIVKRLGENLSRSRALVSPEIVNGYFDNLTATLHGVPPENVFNMDETAMHDDPGKRRVLSRRGAKHPHQIRQSSKATTSVIFCGSASGVLLPPYVVYRADTLNTSWIERGPKGNPCCNGRCCKSGSRYTSTPHGWVDTATFENWFSATFLPHAKTLVGTKVLITDNLAAHFSDHVIQLCAEHDIRFCCLPPNSTDKTQPLDLGFFSPLKSAWRVVLQDYRKEENRSRGILKSHFPRLLRKSLERMGDNCASDLAAGFSNGGIYPLDRDQVLKKLPSDRDSSELGEAFMDILKSMRYEKQGGRAIRGRRVRVAPGTSYAAATTNQNDDSDSGSNTEPDPSGSASNDPEPDASVDTNPESNASSDPGPSGAAGNDAAKFTFLDMPPFSIFSLSYGDIVACRYDGKWYLCQVDKIKREERDLIYYLKFMVPPGPTKEFRWPATKEEGWFDLHDIFAKLKPNALPAPVNFSARAFTISEQTAKEIEEAFLESLVS